jgi:hypothetical protein
MTTRQYAACRRMDRGHWTRPACVRYSLASLHESDLDLEHVPTRIEIHHSRAGATGEGIGAHP